MYNKKATTATETGKNIFPHTLLSELTVGEFSEMVKSLMGAPEPEKFIGRKAAAEMLMISESRLYALTSKGRVPHHKRGGRLYFVREELAEFVRSNKAQ